MTVPSLIHAHGRTYAHEVLPEPVPVFVADQPGHRPAKEAAHVGHAMAEALLHPVLGADGPLVMVRTPAGQLLPVASRAVADATHVAARRIRPAPAGPQRRTA